MVGLRGVWWLWAGREAGSDFTKDQDLPCGRVYRVLKRVHQVVTPAKIGRVRYPSSKMRAPSQNRPFWPGRFWPETKSTQIYKNCERPTESPPGGYARKIVTVRYPRSRGEEHLPQMGHFGRHFGRKQSTKIKTFKNRRWQPMDSKNRQMVE